MGNLPVWKFPLENNDWVGPIKTFNKGVLVTTGIKFAVVSRGSRPVTWVNPDLDPDPPNADFGLYVGPGTSFALTPGFYRIWVQITGVGVKPVFNEVLELEVT